MANTYLTTTFQERLEAEALGAGWDAASWSAAAVMVEVDKLVRRT